MIFGEWLTGEPRKQPIASAEHCAGMGQPQPYARPVANHDQTPDKRLTRIQSRSPFASTRNQPIDS